MAFIDKLKKLISGNEDVPGPKFSELAAERRFNERHDLAMTELVKLETAILNLQVVDISYGGAAILVDEALRGKLDLHQPTPGMLSLPGQQVHMGIEVVHFRQDDQGRDLAGICFHHESRDSLVLLRSIIEPVRLGGTLQPVQQQHLKEEKQIADMKYMRGEGPVDLNFGKDYFNMLFPLVNGEYGEVRWFEGRLATGVTSGADRTRFTGQSIGDTADVRQDLVHTAALILAGACSKHPTLVTPLLSMLLAKYSEWLQSAKSA